MVLMLFGRVVRGAMVDKVNVQRSKLADKVDSMVRVDNYVLENDENHNVVSRNLMDKENASLGLLITASKLEGSFTGDEYIEVCNDVKAEGSAVVPDVVAADVVFDGISVHGA